MNEMKGWMDVEYKSPECRIFLRIFTRHLSLIPLDLRQKSAKTTSSTQTKNKELGRDLFFAYNDQFWEISGSYQYPAHCPLCCVCPF